jgi:hypothetical protein
MCVECNLALISNIYSIIFKSKVLIKQIQQDKMKPKFKIFPAGFPDFEIGNIESLPIKAKEDIQYRGVP